MIKAILLSNIFSALFILSAQCQLLDQLTRLRTDLDTLLLQLQIFKKTEPSVISIDKTEYRRLIIFSGKDADNNLERLEFLTGSLPLAIISESAPILVQPELLQEFIGFKENILQIGKQNHFAFSILEKLKDKYKQDPKKVTPDTLLIRKYPLYPIYQINFTSNNWILCDCPATNFLLLIPKKYIVKILNKDSLIFSQEEENMLGFKLSSFKQLLLPTTNNSEEMSDKLKDISNILDNKIQKMHNTTISDDIKNIILFSIQNLTWNMAMYGHGDATQIAGLPVPMFAEFLKTLNKLSMDTFYYVSCFAGAEQILNQLNRSFTGLANINYTIISGSTTDATVSIVWDLDVASNLLLENNVLMPSHAFHFTDFFQSLEHKKPIETTLQFLTELSVATKSVPLVRFKGTEWFSPVDIQKKVVNVTSASDLAHVIDNTPFIIDSSKKVLVIYPDIVVTPIALTSSARIEIIFKKYGLGQYIDQLRIDNLRTFLNPGLINNWVQFGQNLDLYIGKLLIAKQIDNIPIQIVRSGKDISASVDQNKDNFIFNEALINIPTERSGILPLDVIIKDNSNNRYIKFTPSATKDSQIFVKDVEQSKYYELDVAFNKFKSFNNKKNEIIQKAQEMRKFTADRLLKSQANIP